MNLSWTERISTTTRKTANPLKIQHQFQPCCWWQGQKVAVSYKRKMYSMYLASVNNLLHYCYSAAAAATALPPVVVVVASKHIHIYTFHYIPYIYIYRRSELCYTEISCHTETKFSSHTHTGTHIQAQIAQRLYSTRTHTHTHLKAFTNRNTVGIFRKTQSNSFDLHFPSHLSWVH